MAHTQVDADDFAALSPWAWLLSPYGYAMRRHRGVSIYMAREIAGLSKGDDRNVDHVNRDRLDNRRANLRVIGSKLNAQNTGARRGSTSRFRGVSWDRSKRRWVAQARVGGRNRQLGRYVSEVDAARAAEAFRRNHMPYAEPDPELVGPL